MSRTPAAHLAQLKTAWPEFHIWHSTDGAGFFAVPRDPMYGQAGQPGLKAGTVGELEAQLLDWDKTRNPRPS